MGFTTFDGSDFKFGTPPPGPLAEQLAAWASEASASGRVACVYLTASWCPPSVLLEKSLTDPRMAKALRGVNFATFDIDDATATDALTKGGFPAHTVPVFYLLDADGKRSGPSINGGAWGANTPENMAPPLEAFFDAARAQAGALPSPQVVAELMANSPARAENRGRSEPAPVAAPSAPAASEPRTLNVPTPSLAPRVLLVVAVILVALAAVYFAMWQRAQSRLDVLDETLQRK